MIIEICRNILVIMEVFRNKSQVKFRIIDGGYKECLNAFLNHAFATSTDNNKIPCTCSICSNHFYHKREIVGGHLIMKGADADYHNCIWVFHGEPTMSDDDSNNYMVDDIFNNKNYRLFDHDIRDMIGDTFDCPESNEGSLGLDEEVKPSLS